MNRIAIPNRLQGGAIEDFTHSMIPHWRIWLHTNDWIHGTFLELYPSGKINRVTIRQDEGDDIVCVKPTNT
jgi:hypothetical protein